ncbi:MAG: hypothetical protein J5605_08125, partial [Bacteroidales bacterium]|nr:hypothetical protein [Bacteroidales bacterium]
MKNIKQFVAIVLVGLMFVTSQAQEQRVKNVIILIPDGTCVPVLNLTRWLYGDLTLDNYYCGLSQTYSANAVI